MRRTGRAVILDGNSTHTDDNGNNNKFSPRTSAPLYLSAKTTDKKNKENNSDTTTLTAPSPPPLDHIAHGVTHTQVHDQYIIISGKKKE